jgi:hypothetical protein
VSAPAEPSDRKMSYRLGLCGARGHVALRNHSAEVQR